MNTMIEITAVIFGYGSVATIGILGFGIIMDKLLDTDEQDIKQFVRKTKRTIKRLLKK